MNTKEVIEHIKNWLISYHSQSSTKGFVIGISGGIDSALTSTLVSATKVEVSAESIPPEMPITNPFNEDLL